HKFWECPFIIVGLLPLAASTYRASIHCEDHKLVANERKFSLIGCAVHNVVWILVLTMDFWVYY
ncbi:MAG: hypothetical protein ACI4M9_00025, partial [Succinivibrio sp.]